MAKKAQLHELLAVEGDLSNTAKTVLDEAMVTFEKKPDHFRGFVKSMKYFDEARQQENAREEKGMVTTVEDKLTYALGASQKLFDALLQKEEANQRAKADLEVDGQVIASGLPATFLLGMETRLKAVRDMILRVPTLDPALIWSEDAGAGAGVFRSNAQLSNRTEKQVRFKVLYDATDKHPAQIEKWNEDVPVARIETTHTSGMWTPKRKSDVLGRLDKLIRAVKKARQRANTVEVADLHIANAMTKYILG